MVFVRAPTFYRSVKVAVAKLAIARTPFAGTALCILLLLKEKLIVLC
jgi:hypothetical protein